MDKLLRPSKKTEDCIGKEREERARNESETNSELMLKCMKIADPKKKLPTTDVDAFDNT